MTDAFDVDMGSSRGGGEVKTKLDMGAGLARITTTNPNFFLDREAAIEKLVGVVSANYTKAFAQLTAATAAAAGAPAVAPAPTTEPIATSEPAPIDIEGKASHTAAPSVGDDDEIAA